MFIQKMAEKFNPEAACDLNATYLFQIEDEGEYALKIANQNFEIIEGQVDNPNVTLKADKQTWDSIISGKMPAQMAFMMGKLSVTGDLPLALKLASIFSLG